MVAVFTPQTELQQARYAASKNFLLPANHFKGATKYAGRLHVRRAANGDVTFEPLDDTWAGAGILENDLIAVVEPGLRVNGCWTLRTVVAGEERNVDPVDPPPEIVNTLVEAVSSDPISPNFTRGVRDQIIDVEISETIQLDTNNHRARGTLGFSAFSDNLRQLTFAGVLTGSPRLGDTITGGTSGAVGTVVGMSPGITQGGAGHWIIVDMGVDYAGTEYVGAEDVGLGTLESDPLGARSLSPLSPIGTERRSAPKPLVPPFASDTVNWWDATDLSTLFEDQIGTIPASDAGLVRRTNNKGSSGLEVSESGTSVPTLLTAGAFSPNGLPYLDGAQGYFVNPFADGVDWSAGLTVCGFFNCNATALNTIAIFAYDNSDVNWQFIGTSPWRINLPGIGFQNFAKTSVNDEWVWGYATVNAAGDWAIRMAGAAETTGSGTYVAPTGGGGLSLWGAPTFTARRGETFMYNRYLAPAERPAIIAYFDAKYGVAPF